MKSISELPVEIIVGGSLPDIYVRPLRPYSSEAIEFLSALSSRIFQSPALREFPDLAAFAYWCRRANLVRLSQSFDVSYQRIGRGLVLHIAPGNVPVNFAFSLAFGLLAGNGNIVRISAINPQTEIICDEISNLLTNALYSRMEGMIRIIRYPRNDAITSKLSMICHARVLWGGDKTVSHLRSIPTSPRCVDVCFPNRYSLCILGANSILNINEKSLSTLVRGFYNDAFLLDQNACSSPRLVLWQGDEDEVAQAMNRFWQAMESFLQMKPTPPSIQAVEKFSQACLSAIFIKNSKALVRHQNLIHRIYLDNVPCNIRSYPGRYGFFYEAIDTKLINLKSIIDEHYQTVSFFGTEKEDIVNLVYEYGLTGIDRIVPVGKALDMGAVWDGYDMIGMLSRIISSN